MNTTQLLRSCLIFSTTVHLSLSDATGDKAILEYVGGILFIPHDSSYTVMTNPQFLKNRLVSINIGREFRAPSCCLGQIVPRTGLKEPPTSLTTSLRLTKWKWRFLQSSGIALFHLEFRLRMNATYPRQVGGLVLTKKI